MDRHEGGCLCGHIRFVANGAAQRPHTCSCKMCQRHTGALTLAWVAFPRANISWIGPGGEPTLFSSSDRMSRAFCPRCGSTIGAIDERDMVRLLLGVFDVNTGPSLAPAFHAHATKQPSWWRVIIGGLD